MGGGSFVAPTATGGVDPDFNLDEGFIQAGNDAKFTGSVAEGTTSDRFFVSYAGPIATDGSLELFIRAGEGITFTDGTALVVPEPGTALLLALGAALTAALSVRARRSEGSSRR